jgi:hypothetical protein
MSLDPAQELSAKSPNMTEVSEVQIEKALNMEMGIVSFPRENEVREIWRENRIVCTGR